MLLWLSTPDISAPSITEENATNQKKPNIRKERIRQNALIAWVYIFCFINMENVSSRIGFCQYSHINSAFTE